MCVTQISSRFSVAFFPLPRLSHRTTASLPYTFNVHCTFGGYAVEAQVRGKPHFHNALTIVRAAPDWPTLVFHTAYKYFTARLHTAYKHFTARGCRMGTVVWLATRQPCRIETALHSFILGCSQFRYCYYRHTGTVSHTLYVTLSMFVTG